MIAVERHNKYIIIDLLILMESGTNIFLNIKLLKIERILAPAKGIIITIVFSC